MALVMGEVAGSPGHDVPGTGALCILLDSVSVPSLAGLACSLCSSVACDGDESVLILVLSVDGIYARPQPLR